MAKVFVVRLFSKELASSSIISDRPGFDTETDTDTGTCTDAQLATLALRCNQVADASRRRETDTDSRDYRETQQGDARDCIGRTFLTGGIQCIWEYPTVCLTVSLAGVGI